MPRSGVHQYSLFCGLVTLSVSVFAFAPSSFSREGKAAELIPVKDIPDRFFQVQGSNGFFWQAVKNGAITSGETQYLQSGLNLLIDGENFSPAAAKVREPTDDVPGVVELMEKREGVLIVRTMIFDRERGAVQVVDELQNTSGKDLSLPVDLRTTYPFGWESLHGQGGGLLSRDPVLALGEEDAGMIIHFSAAEGRHDTLIVSGMGEVKAKLIGSTNRRELTLRYDLTIPAGQKQSLLHFLGQVTIPDMAKSDEAFASFLRSRRLVNSVARAEVVKTIVNFPQEAFTEESASPEKLGSLIALNEFLDRMGVYRRPKDMLWLSATSQITGTLSAKATVSVQGASGEPRKFGIKEVAAIRGGSGVGRPARVFLRDGTVVAGAVTAVDLSFKADGESEAQELDTDALHLCLTKTSSGDGVIPKGTVGFLELANGDVIPLSGAEEKIPVVASWGRMELPLSSLREIQHVREPMSSHRVLAVDGSRYSVFLSGATTALSIAGGERREVPVRSISRYWSADVTDIEEFATDEMWLDFSELPESPEVKQGFLLQGNQLLAGTFAEATVSFRTDGPVIRVEAERIRSIRRNLDVADFTNGRSNFYSVELKNGESLEGVIADSFLTILRDGERIRISFDQLLSYRSF
jgi:hypothetical protein